MGLLKNTIRYFSISITRFGTLVDSEWPRDVGWEWEDYYDGVEILSAPAAGVTPKNSDADGAHPIRFISDINGFGLERGE